MSSLLSWFGITGKVDSATRLRQAREFLQSEQDLGHGKWELHTKKMFRRDSSPISEVLKTKWKETGRNWFGSRTRHRNSAVKHFCKLIIQNEQAKSNQGGSNNNVAFERATELLNRIGSGEDLCFTVNDMLNLLDGDAPDEFIDNVLKGYLADVKEEAFDDNAFLLSPGIGSETEQRRMVRATIQSADKFAVITTYGIKPVGPDGKVTNTTRPILTALAERQHDQNFTFCLFYNKSAPLQNMVAGKRTKVSVDPAATDQTNWMDVVDAYNDELVEAFNEAVDEGKLSEAKKVKSAMELARSDHLEKAVQRGFLAGKPLVDVECNIYLIEGAPRGGGSHHNKFSINDSGLAATFGASIGNRNKPSWFDCGVVALSKRLVQSQREFFLNKLLPLGEHLGKLEVKQGQASVESALNSRDAQSMSERITDAMENVEIQEPFLDRDGCRVNDQLNRGLVASRLTPLEGNSRARIDGSMGKVGWVKNLGSTFAPRTKPLGKAMENMFQQARRGDTLCVRNRFFGEKAQRLALNALRRGVNLQLLGPLEHDKLSEKKYYLKQIQKLMKAVAKDQDKRQRLDWGTFEFRAFDPNDRVRQKHDFDDEGFAVTDHAKVYAWKRSNQSGSYLMTGTYNLDGQSQKRSHENMMVIQSSSGDLTESLFDDFWDCSSRVTLENVNSALKEIRFKDLKG